MSKVLTMRLLTCRGWLLMVPYLEGTLDNARVRRDLPINQWRQTEAFDRAWAFEHAKTAMLKFLLDGGTKAYSSTYSAWNDARCIPADHLYPPRMPNPK
jgi:hypothetical protein